VGNSGSPPPGSFPRRVSCPQPCPRRTAARRLPAASFHPQILLKTRFFFGIPFASKLAVDLDLKIYDSNGNQVGYSGSWDNSYEIAEFQGPPGQTYTIRIRRWSGTDKVYYGIAWTVTGGLLLAHRLLRIASS